MNENIFDDIPMPDDNHLQGFLASPRFQMPVDDSILQAQQASHDNPQNTTPECNFDLENFKLTSGEEEIVKIFKDGGKLSTTAKFFKERYPQICMVKAILAAMRNKKNLVVEAGTGTGKTFAYLIPLLQMGKKVVVSTKTKNLQDQLDDKDVSYLVSIFKKGYKTAILKGRENYLCRLRIDSFSQNIEKGKNTPSGKSHVPHDFFYQLKDFSENSLTGEVADFQYKGQLYNQDEDYTSKFVARSSTCQGLKKCKFASTCFLKRARQNALDSDLVIVNHSLYFANAKVSKADKKCSLLPDNTDVVVFDEAHHLLNEVRHSFATELGYKNIAELRELLDDIRNNLLTVLTASVSSPFANSIKNRKNAQEEINKLFTDTDNILLHKSRDLANTLFVSLSRENLVMTGVKDRSSLSITLGKAVQNKDFVKNCEEYIKELTELKDDFKTGAAKLMLTDSISPVAAMIINFLEVLSDFISGISEFCKATSAEDLEHVRIVTLTDKSFDFTTTPLDVADMFQTYVLGKNKSEEPVTKFVFTSATLQINKSFDDFTSKLGLDNFYTCALPSPFDYLRQSCLYFPNIVPDGKEFGDNHVNSVINYVTPLFNVISGGFLILCTSTGVMNKIFNTLFTRELSLQRKVYCQHKDNKAELIRNMQQQGNAVVVATQSFWEGIDIRGSALSCVVIDRLPFLPVNDPLVKALTDYYEKKLGKSGFFSYSLPEMVVNLRQGVGRLIRSEDDIGVIAIADSRLSPQSSCSYGAKIRRELPPMKIVRTVAEVKQFMNQPAKLPNK